MSRGATGLSVAVALILGACSGGTPASQSPASSGVAAGSPAANPSVEPSAELATTAPTLTPLEPLKLLWQQGGPTDIQTETYWPTINPITKDIWVASGFQNEFWIFKPDGTYVGSWGKAGSGPGQLNLTTHDVHPDGVGAIAFAPDGSFYVADVGNYRVQKFDKNGNFVTMWGSFGTNDGQFGQPKGIVTDGTTVYVADDPRGDVQAFDANGHYLRKFPFPTIFLTMVGSNTLWSGGGLGGTFDPGTVVEWDGRGTALATYPIDPTIVDGGGISVVLFDQATRHLIVLVGGRQDGSARDASVVVEMDLQGHILRSWSASGESATLSPDGKSLYTAFTDISNTGWPYIKKYALP